MSNLTPRSQRSLFSASAPDGFTRQEGKALTQAQNAEVARGLVIGTRVQAAAFVANTAIQATASLSREARFLADGDERTAERLEHIVDGFTFFAANELNRFRS
ncbi:MAG: hypothetical protein QM589_17455 [Thermomicrobiales bacterium]